MLDQGLAESDATKIKKSHGKQTVEVSIDNQIEEIISSVAIRKMKGKQISSKTTIGTYCKLIDGKS